MTTETTEGPTIAGVLAQLMREAESAAAATVDLSENAEEPEGHNPAEDPETMIVNYDELGEVRYKAKRVLVLLEKIREAFPDETRIVSTFCESCGVHTDHGSDQHEAAVAASKARKTEAAKYLETTST